MSRQARRLVGLAPAVVIAAVVLLAGCTPVFSPAGNDMAPRSQQILNYQLVTGASDIAGLDPGASFADLKETGLSAHAASLLPISLVFSGLVALDRNLAVENWDAKHIAVSADGLTYTFTLRDDLKFSDGKPVTAADYAFGINRTLDPCLASAVAPYLYEIKDAITFNAERCTLGTGGGTNTYDKGYAQTTPVLKDLLHDSVVASDPKTLVITLAAPASYFLAALAYPAGDAIEQSVVGSGVSDSKWTESLSKGPTGQGGSGPYYVSSWNHKGTLVLKANPNFRTPPHLETINFTIFTDAASAYKAYTSGTTDIGYPPVASLAQARGQSDYHEHAALWTNYLGLNWQQAPFDDVRARQAFALALNKDQLNSDALGGAQLPTNHLIPSGMPGYNAAVVGPAGVASTQGDANKAKALWQDYAKDKCGGQAANCAAVTLSYSSSSATADAVSKRMAQMWKAVLGVDVTLQPVEFDTLLGQLATGSVQFWNIGWRAYYPDPQNWLSLQFLCCPEAAYNAGHVNQADANTLLTQADASLDQTQRLKQYQQAEQKLVDQVAWIPYDQVMNHWQNRAWIHGYAETAQGEPSLDQWLAMYVANH
jgi:peptide/nickel transport system substrate-binding protein/oligopeptide transport system substrate-binding protein